MDSQETSSLVQDAESGSRQGLLAQVPDALSSYILVVDSEGRILEYNRAATGLFDAPAHEVLHRRGGDALRCSHARETPGGCGCSLVCSACPLRRSLEEVLGGARKVRRRVHMKLERNGKTVDFLGVVTGAPIEHKGVMSVVLVIDNLEELLDMRRVLPICMSCGNVQSDGRSWVRVESHLNRNYDVDVSHGYCPDCAETALRDAMRSL